MPDTLILEKLGILEEKVDKVCKKVDHIDIAIRGNGDRQGLVHKVDLVEKWQKNRTWVERVVLSTIIITLVTIILTGVLKWPS